jgi:hypothetical protein
MKSKVWTNGSEVVAELCLDPLGLRTLVFRMDNTIADELGRALVDAAKEARD